MKTIVIYYSNHHLNTFKLVNFLAGNENIEFDMVELKNRNNEEEPVIEVDLSSYDRVILASGIYYGKLSEEIYDFVEVYRDVLAKKEVSVVATAALESVDYIKDFEEDIKKMGISLKGKFQCKGYCTFGPLQLIGGFSKNHPNQEDFDKLLEFYNNL